VIVVASADQGDCPVCHLADYPSEDGTAWKPPLAYQALVVSVAMDPRGEAQDALQAARPSAAVSIHRSA
jgi:hypothetical protein